MEWIRNNVKDLSSQLHHSKGMLEPPVSGTGINEVSESQLVDIAKSLNGLRVEHLALFRSDPYEPMNRVANLVNNLRKHLNITLAGSKIPIM